MISWQGRIFLATAPVDFRGSFDQLSGMVREQLKATRGPARSSCP